MENNLSKNKYPFRNIKKKIMNTVLEENKKEKVEIESKTKEPYPKQDNINISNPVDILDKLTLIYENIEKNNNTSK